MKKHSYDSLPIFTAKCIALQKADFAWLGLVVACVFAILQLLFLGIAAFGGSTELLHASIPGLMALLAAAAISIFQAAGRFSMEMRMGIHMSITRRRLLAAQTGVALANGAELVGIAAVLQLIWHIVFGGAADADDIMAAFPLWGWLMCIYLPVAMGILSGGIMMRFGKRGFWVLYGIFLLCCFVPSLSDKNSLLGTVNWELVVSVLPFAGPIIAVIMAAAGFIILWRVPVTE